MQPVNVCVWSLKREIFFLLEKSWIAERASLVAGQHTRDY